MSRAGEFVLQLLPTVAVYAVIALILAGLRRLPVKTIAQMSVGTNILHFILSVIFPKHLLPYETVAFPGSAQLLFSFEFLVAGIAATRWIDKRLTAQRKAALDGHVLSITAVEPEPLQGQASERPEWLWPSVAVISYLCLWAAILSLHAPKFVQ